MIPTARFSLVLSVLTLLFLTAFSPDERSGEKAIIEIPQGFPELNFPEDNAFTQARWELGKRLFYDPILSVDSSLSCASCHKSDLAFADNLPKTPGVFDRPGKRNAPTLANVAWLPYTLFEGSVPTLEMQILVPIQEHNEFDFNIVLIAEKLNKQASYVEMSQKAYQRTPDAFVITRAIATFERSLISGNSRYDQFEFQGNTSALSELEQKGKDLFFSSKTNCSACHSSVFFTSFEFKNNGLYDEYTDEGRYHFTGIPADSGLFKIPTLRNIELTAPYMHDGSVQTLEEVVNHYNSGGSSFKNKDQLIKALGLSEDEKLQLVAFLKTLTDDEFVDNE
ncbi:MAG: cytochrome-c peroxidase, partial [Flavobacteriales bacterium]